MTPLTCEEVSELAGAYALGLLDADERATIEDHLAEHWHEEYAGARAAVLALASAAPEAEPSPALRARILDAARLETKRGSRRWIPGMLAAAAAAAAILVALNLAGVFPARGTPPQQLVLNAGSGAFLELAVEGSSSRASVRLGGLPTRPGAEVYQVWVSRPGEAPKSLSIIGADREGPWTKAVDIRLKRGDTVAVTAEPDDSRVGPTQPPLLVGQYR